MTRPRDWPVLAGMLPLRRSQAAADVPAGLAPAALAVPQALGYAKIAGMPVETGLYTLLVPMAMFAVLEPRRRSARHGVAVIGPFPRGLPPLALPAFTVHAAAHLLGPAASMFVVILAQSEATARAYAAKYGERRSADADLAGLGAANVAAAFSGAFVVNGSPTQTQMVDSAGGRSQLAQLTTAAVVLLVLLFATAPLASLPIAALAAAAFVIAISLVDLRSLRRIWSVRRDEFAIAVLAAAAVVVLGVQDGIVLAVVASVVDHLRHTYHPANSVLVKSPGGHWQAAPVRPGARTEPGLVVYRFGTSLYYANASRLAEDVSTLTGQGGPLRWMVLDAAAIDDIDYTAASVLTRVVGKLRDQHVRLIVTSVVGPVREQLDRYGISAALGSGAFTTTRARL